MWRYIRPLTTLIHLGIWPFFNLLLWAFARWQIVNRHYLKDAQPPFIIVSNHKSRLDHFIISAALPFSLRYFPLSFTAYDYLMRLPIIGFGIWLLGGYGIKKGIGLEKSLARAIEILRLKGLVFIYPEGKVRTLGRPRKPRRGVAFLAASVPNATIIPVNLGYQRLSLIKFFTGYYRIKIIFGEPFKIADIARTLPKTKAQLSSAAEKIMAKSRGLKSLS